MANAVFVGGGSVLTNGGNTASLTWTAGRGHYLAITCAYSSSAPSSFTIGGATWNLQGAVRSYRARRAVAIYKAAADPTNGAIAITANGGGGTFAGIEYCAIDVSDYNNATTPKAGVSDVDVATGSTSLNSGAIGTLAANEIALIAGGCEGGSDSFAVGSGVTSLYNVQGLSDIRSMVAGFSTTNSTPGVTWSNTSVGAGLVAFIITNGTDGASGGGGPTPPTDLTQNTVKGTSFNCVVSGAGGTTTQYEWRVDGGTAVNGGASTTRSFTGLQPGTSYLIEVRAGDASNNWSAWYGESFSTDAGAWTTTATLSAAMSGMTALTQYRFEVQATSDSTNYSASASADFTTSSAVSGSASVVVNSRALTVANRILRTG